MKRLTPAKLLNICMVVVFVLLVLPLYVAKGLNDSMDHARGTGTVGGIDFKAYYIAADLLRQGRDFYSIEEQLSEVEHLELPTNESFYIYPPLLAMLFVPLTALPLARAAQIWFFGNLLLYGLSLILVSRSLDLGSRTKVPALLWVLAFLYPPALFTLYKGQANIVILFLLALVYFLLLRGLAARAGVALGLGSMIKIVPVLLLPYYLWKRQYLLVFATLLTLFILVVTTVVVVGTGPVRTFVSWVLPTLAAPRPNPANQSLGGFFSLLLLGNPYTWNLVDSPSLWKALTGATSAVVLGGAAFLLWRHQRCASTSDLEYALIVASFPLLSNIAWVDMFVLLVIPYAVLCRHALDYRLGPTWIALIAVSATLISFPRLQDLLSTLPLSWSPLIHNPFVIGLPLYGAIILWIVVAAALWRKPGQEDRLARP
jgi:hypothetical protein